MIALDTNVLLRALVDDADAPDQCAAARQLLAESRGVVISAVVFLETLWTLSRSFGYSRAQVCRVGALLLDHPRYHVRSEDLCAAALERYANSKIDFADAVALVDAGSGGCILHTFGHKLARLPGTQLVK